MKSPKGRPMPTRQELLEKFGEVENPRDRALLSFLYLTGARIREALAITKRNIRKEGKYYVITLPTEKKFDIIKKEFVSYKKSIVKGYVVYVGKKRKFLTKRRLETRNVPISIARDMEFIKMMAPWINSRQKDESLWGFKSRQRAWQIVGKYGLFPHFLRHIRLTYLVTERNFTDQDLVQFTGWADSKPAKHYVHMRWRDIAEKV